jgi:hypothetical protein
MVFSFFFQLINGFFLYVYIGIFRARRNYEESDNVFVSYSRAFTDRISDTFGKTLQTKT